MATKLAYNPAICADEGGTGYNIHWCSALPW